MTAVAGTWIVVSPPPVMAVGADQPVNQGWNQDRVQTIFAVRTSGSWSNFLFNHFDFILAGVLPPPPARDRHSAVQNVENLPWVNPF